MIVYDIYESNMAYLVDSSHPAHSSLSHTDESMSEGYAHKTLSHLQGEVMHFYEGLLAEELEVFVQWVYVHNHHLELRVLGEFGMEQANNFDVMLVKQLKRIGEQGHFVIVRHGRFNSRYVTCGDEHWAADFQSFKQLKWGVRDALITGTDFEGHCNLRSVVVQSGRVEVDDKRISFNDLEKYIFPGAGS